MRQAMKEILEIQANIDWFQKRISIYKMVRPTKRPVESSNETNVSNENSSDDSQGSDIQWVRPPKKKQSSSQFKHAKLIYLLDEETLDTQDVDLEVI